MAGDAPSERGKQAANSRPPVRRVHTQLPSAGHSESHLEGHDRCQSRSEVSFFPFAAEMTDSLVAATECRIRAPIRAPRMCDRVKSTASSGIPHSIPPHMVVEWYRIPDARYFCVMRPNLGRLSTFESFWEAWRDPISVLIRVLQPDLVHDRFPGSGDANLRLSGAKAEVSRPRAPAEACRGAAG